MKTKISLVLLLFPLLLFSCVSMESDITIRNNGSVKAELSYRISQYVMGFGRLDSEDSFIPLPVSEQDFQFRALQTEGVEYTDYSLKEDEDYAYITATLECQDLAALAAFLGQEIELSGSADDQALRYTLMEEKTETIEGDQKELIDLLFGEDIIKVTLNTPRPISSYSDGTLSDNRRSITYTKEMVAAILAKDAVIWTVSY